ncbi:FAD-dependent pyridine nucleotide-disulfide oxidoreductase [Sphingobium indicum IP26]|nr:FAD-dependent pyridine nucleotide-disulfide oxidoreductase [Sphingobium indicum IP26]EQB06482.1 FAD-dependent pyridine nucleotide-disulfide oxidoreductase [Sphingobium sp. HDIP04]
MGGGFAGLACARELGGKPIRVTIIDRNNYHLFVPLLYQVATAALSPADIAQPIRRILRRHDNIEVVLGEAVGVDPQSRRLSLADGSSLHFDRLVIATGSRYNYFAHPEWEPLAPGLRSIEDARLLRSRILRGFELAERQPDPHRRAELMTIVIVGAGPTGVEMAGAIAELAHYTLARDFRHIDPGAVRILLVEAGKQILTSFPDGLSTYARRRLEAMGVEIMLGKSLEDIDGDTLVIGGQRLRAGTIIWAAGIKASPAAFWLQAECDRSGRVRVATDFSVPGHPHIHVLGDSAAMNDEAGQPLPALAQVAQQQGRYLGQSLSREFTGRAPLPPFRFRDRGNTAIIGRNAAIFDFGKRRLKGRLAWLLWAIVHVYLLVGFEKRLLVSIQWLWRYFTYQRGARLITQPPPPLSQGLPDQGKRAAMPTDDNERMKPGDQAPAGTEGTGENLCPTCGGGGRLNGEPCPNCEGTGKVIEGIGGG